jgi:hypothetical protein
MHKQTYKGTLKPPILVGNLQEDALNIILEVDATDGLSNQDSKLKKSFQQSLM